MDVSISNADLQHREKQKASVGQNVPRRQREDIAKAKNLFQLPPPTIPALPSLLSSVMPATQDKTPLTVAALNGNTTACHATLMV